MEHQTNGDVSSAPSGEHEPELLKAHEDLYDGVIVELDNTPSDVEPDNTPSDVARFVSSLRASLLEWEKKVSFNKSCRRMPYCVSFSISFLILNSFHDAYILYF